MRCWFDDPGTKHGRHLLRYFSFASRKINVVLPPKMMFGCDRRFLLSTFSLPKLNYRLMVSKKKILPLSAVSSFPNVANDRLLFTDKVLFKLFASFFVPFLLPPLSVDFFSPPGLLRRVRLPFDCGSTVANSECANITDTGNRGMFAISFDYSLYTFRLLPPVALLPRRSSK